MKVHELIGYLNKMNPNLDVYVIGYYGDYDGAPLDNPPYIKDCEIYSEEPDEFEPSYKKVCLIGGEND